QPTIARQGFRRRFTSPSHRDRPLYASSAYKESARVRLVSRNGRDHTRRFAGIAAAVAKLSTRSLVLDGDVTIYDDKLRSRFDWLREPDPDAVATPPCSWPLTSFTTLDVISSDVRSANVGLGWRMRSPTTTSVHHHDGHGHPRRAARSGGAAGRKGAR